MDRKEKDALIKEFETTLNDNILNFWSTRMVDPSGGFYGRIDGEGNLHPEAKRGAVMYSRILWAYAAAYRLTGRTDYLELAQKARDYIVDNFFDPEYGGMFWSLNPDGTPADDKVQFYSLGFAIYGLSELVRATGDSLAYSLARRLFNDIELHGYDEINGGYIEATSRDWQPIKDMRLSEKDKNLPKSMNTHLHLLEPYTNLLRVWRDPKLERRVRELIEIFLNKIFDEKSGHLGMFFDREWHHEDNIISYGHDIEASWLLLEAAQTLGDSQLLERTLNITKKIALASVEGLCEDGSMYYGRNEDGGLDEDRHWWVQAENVVGQLWLWKYHDMPEMLPKAIKSWEYIKKNLIDPEGEWYWSRKGDGSINQEDDKAGFWKCPYHNARMCIEAIGLLSDKQI